MAQWQNMSEPNLDSFIEGKFVIYNIIIGDYYLLPIGTDIYQSF